MCLLRRISSASKLGKVCLEINVVKEIEQKVVETDDVVVTEITDYVTRGVRLVGLGGRTSRVVCVIK